jgi:hypothetical protein
MSGADLIDFETLEASGEDGNEGDLDESDEVLPLEDRVQPPIAAQPGEGAFHDPANSGREELSIPAASDRLRRLRKINALNMDNCRSTVFGRRRRR